MANPHPSTGFQNYPEKINKNGRPHKEKSLTHALLQKISIEDLADKIKELIEQGDAATLRFVFEQIDGKAVQKQILSTESEEPFEIIIKEEKA